MRGNAKCRTTIPLGVVLAPTFGVMLWMMWAKAYGIHGAKRTEAKVDRFVCIEPFYRFTLGNAITQR